MADWVMWLIWAGGLVVVELFTGTFYLLMLALGLAAGALAALAGAAMWLQLLVAALVGVIATLTLRRSRFGKSGKVDAAHDPNVNLDIGQQVSISKWSEHPGGGQPTARVTYRGAMWDVELAPGSAVRAGAFTIREMRGSRLIVSGDGVDVFSGSSSDNN